MSNDDQSPDAPAATPPEPPRDGSRSIEDRLKRLDRWGLIAGGVVAVAVIGLIAVLLTGGGRETPAESGLQVTPSGAEAPRLGPVIVSFPEAPSTQVPEDLVRIEPAPEGEFAWLDDHTLLFQPDFPGLVRGREYSVTVSGSATGTGEDVVQTFTVEGKLEVRSVIPAPGDDEVPSEARIFVQFSRAVAPLTLLSEASPGPVVAFDPPLSGQGEWLNNSLYAFTPTDLRPSTTYHATVAAGLTSAADGVLEGDYEWEFSTFQPALATSTPADGTSYVPRDQQIIVAFNQPMDEDVAGRVEFTTASGEAVAHATSWSADGTTLTLAPNDLLELSTEYRVTLPAGLAGAAGGATASERVILFRTVDPPRVASTSPSDGETSAGRYGIYIEFNNPMDIGTLQDAITISGIAREDWTLYSYGGQSVNINVPLEPSTDYTVSIGDGVRDRSGLPLPPYSWSFTTGALESGAYFATPSDVGVYSAAREQELLIWATNVDSVELTLHALTDDEAKQYLRGEGFKDEPDNPIRTWSVDVDAEQNESTLLSTTLGEDGPLAPGYYWVETQKLNQRSSSFFFVVTDTTIVTKLALDELLVWAIDYETGKPVANLDLRVDGPGVGSTIRTNAEGIATLPVPRPSEVTNEDRRYVVTSASPGQFAAAHTDMTAGSEDWLLGVPISYWDQSMVGHVYTDRPIYRSGETVEFKAVVRDDRDANYTIPPVGETDVTLVITDAQGEEINREPVVANEFGTFADSVSLADEAPTGYYNVSLRQQMDGWENWITSTAFQVAEFRTPEFRVEMTPVRADVVDGDTIDVDLEASFFFGGPLANADVQWSAYAYPTGVSFEGYERYSFSDSDAFSDSFSDDPQRGGGELTTGNDGVALITLPAALRADESTMAFQVSGTVLDQSGQAIGADTTVTVHPSSVYAGVTPEEYIGETGRSSRILVASVDIDGNPVPNQRINVDIVSREWTTVLEETASGTRRYVATPRDTVLETRTVTTNGDGFGSLDYTPESSGLLRFAVRTTDAQGRTARAASYLWVAGPERAAWAVDNDNVIELIANADSYEVGDTAEVLIPAPYEGSQALITIERGGILSRELRFLDSNSALVEVPITSEYVPNVFVSVVLYRAPTEDDPVPRYNVGSVELPVSTVTRELNVDLEPSVEQAQPGDTVEYDITVTDSTGAPVSAEVSVAMVDAAVLSLSDFVDQNGLQAFWFQRGLGVRTASSAAVDVERNNDTVSEPEAGGKGGGGEEAEAFRTQFRNTAYWSPQVTTGPDGRARVEITLPDNLTTWQTQVRAVSGDTLVGEATDEIVATTPLLVRPALPRFLRVGDAVTLRTLVRNATDEPQEVTVTIDVNGVDLEDDAEQLLTVAPGESGDFAWTAHATTEGTAKIAFRATAGDLADGVQLELPVYLDVTPETMSTGGVVEDQSAIEAIYLPRYAITDRGSLDVGIQASIVGALESELSELTAFDEESTVRTASRVIATIGARQAKGYEGDDVFAPVEDDLRRLQAIQRGDSGWGYCARYCSTDPVVTAWVLTAFGDAIDAGWDSPNVQWRQGITSIRDHLDRVSDVANPIDPNEEAFLLYAMQQARGDEVLVNSLRSIYEQHREELTPWGEAYLVLALVDSAVEPDDAMVRGLVSDLNASVIPSANGNHWEAVPLYGSIESNVSMTALVLRALAEVDPEHPLIEETARWLVTARNADRWHSDVERAQAIRGLGSYAALTGERRGDFDFRVLLDEDNIMDGHLAVGPHEGTSSASVRLPLSGITPGEVHRLAFERETGAGRLYYVLNLRYVTPAAEVESLSRGLSVAHEYTLVGDPDRPITEARLGDLVRVKVTVVADADRKFVQVEDYLPAGLEALDTQRATVPDDVRRQLDEERRDALAGDNEDIKAYAPWYGWYWSPWDQTDARDDRFSLFATELPRGVHEYVYYARATTLGAFFVSPATAQEGPFPEVFGRSDSGRFSVLR